MKANLKKTIAVMAAATLVVVAGCNSRQKKVTKIPAPIKSQVEKSCVIKTECLAKYLKNSTGPFLTNQKHQIVPASATFVMETSTSDAEYKYTLSGNKFSVKKSPIAGGPASSVDAVLCDCQLAKLVRESILLSSGLSCCNLEPATEKNTIRIKGIWYSVTEIREQNMLVKLFARTDTCRVERLQVTDCKTGKILSSHCYNFSSVAGIENALPGKIDVFEGAADDFDAELIIQFKYSMFCL